jgi:hypothetical protein
MRQRTDDRKQRAEDIRRRTEARRQMAPVLAFARKQRGYNAAGGVREGNWEAV